MHTVLQKFLSSTILAATSLDDSYIRCRNIRLNRSLPPQALKDACSDLHDKLQLVEECVKRLHMGLTRSKQPGLLSPIRLNARSKTVVQGIKTPYFILLKIYTRCLILFICQDLFVPRLKSCLSVKFRSCQDSKH